MYGGQVGACCTPTQELCLKSAEGLPKMMIVIATVFDAAGLTVSEKMEIMLFVWIVSAMTVSCSRRLV